MAGHIDTHVLIGAPLELTWRLANTQENDRRHSPDGKGHELVAEDPARNARTLRIVTPPDAGGREWSYFVERILDPERHTAYARRWGNPHFRYSVALWVYREEPGGRSSIRSVQDFEMTDDAPVDDDGMAEIILGGTRRALQHTKEFVEAEAAAATV
ncbi:polyketide cyclase [Streptomyces oryzae]|uniref:Polyketide cyclase n=1 Tax=Streptomyces oryzae TaxID=1434886 RepID=A0ABS3X6Y5_9ACTN|nr:hypothetical protein [Streptomyces oryzae]MBO8191111.1 polyketide cyclase [Streptomyces oryzae]